VYAAKIDIARERVYVEEIRSMRQRICVYMAEIEIAREQATVDICVVLGRKLSVFTSFDNVTHPHVSRDSFVCFQRLFHTS